MRKADVCVCGSVCVQATSVHVNVCDRRGPLACSCDCAGAEHCVQQSATLRKSLILQQTGNGPQRSAISKKSEWVKKYWRDQRKGSNCVKDDVNPYLLSFLDLSSQVLERLRQIEAGEVPLW